MMTEPTPVTDTRPARRLLALDLGARRTGVAVSDDLGLYAHARAAIFARSRAELVSAIAGRAREEAADEIVVGLPLSLSGADSAQTAEARAIAAELRALTGLLVTETDERLSSREAATYVRGRNARRSGAQDSAAAAIILQGVLDRRRGAPR